MPPVVKPTAAPEPTGIDRLINLLVTHYGLPPSIASAYAQSVQSGRQAAAANAAHPAPSPMGHIDLTGDGSVDLSEPTPQAQPEPRRQLRPGEMPDPLGLSPIPFRF